MAANFHYEWWTVEVLLDVGKTTLEFKGKSKEHVIKRIRQSVAETNSEKNLETHWWKRHNQIKEVYWETLALDRIGYNTLR